MTKVEKGYVWFKQVCFLPENKEFLNIVDIVEKSNVPVFYFYPAFCDNDKEQYEFVREIKNIYTFPINSDIHGSIFGRKTLKRILNSTPERLVFLYKQNKSKILRKNFWKNPQPMQAVLYLISILVWKTKKIIF